MNIKRNFSSTTRLQMNAPTAVAVATAAPAASKGLVYLVLTLAGSVVALKTNELSVLVNIDPTDLSIILDKSVDILKDLDVLYKQILSLNPSTSYILNEHITHDCGVANQAWHTLLCKIMEISQNELELSGNIQIFENDHVNALTVANMWNDSYHVSQQVIKHLHNLLGLNKIPVEQVNRIIDLIQKIDKDIHILSRIMPNSASGSID